MCLLLLGHAAYKYKNGILPILLNNNHHSKLNFSQMKPNAVSKAFDSILRCRSRQELRGNNCPETSEQLQQNQEQGEDQLYLDLDKAKKIILRLEDELEAAQTKLAELDFIYLYTKSSGIDFEHLQSQQSFGTDIPFAHRKNQQKHNIEWIEDIWIRGQSSIPCLQEGESMWKAEGPRTTLEFVLQKLPSISPLLSSYEATWCDLFVSALLHSMHRYEDSGNNVAQIILTTSSCYADSRDVKYLDQHDLAQFIQGQNYLAAFMFRKAYMIFSRLLGVPSYSSRARLYQQKIITDLVSREAINGIKEVSCLRPSWI